MLFNGIHRERAVVELLAPDVAPGRPVLVIWYPRRFTSRGTAREWIAGQKGRGQTEYRPGTAPEWNPADHLSTTRSSMRGHNRIPGTRLTLDGGPRRASKRLRRRITVTFWGVGYAVDCPMLQILNVDGMPLND